ncbi:MAG: hypothetical protein KGI08_02770 [Thaumarchaeota archaeon]|nr:hypothetical protein [Nitrososphaerota archaeon]
MPKATYMINGHYELKDFSSDNWKLYEVNPDPDFHPEKNYAVIRKIIKEAYKRHNSLDEKVLKASGNVADILASFAKYKLDKDGSKQIEKWLGNYELAKIYGEKLMQQLKIRDSVSKLQMDRKFINKYLKDKI